MQQAETNVPADIQNK